MMNVKIYRSASIRPLYFMILIVGLACGCGTNQVPNASPEEWHPAEFIGTACGPETGGPPFTHGPDLECNAERDGYAYARFELQLEPEADCMTFARKQFTRELQLRAVMELCELTSGVDWVGVPWKARRLLAASKNTDLFACCRSEENTGRCLDPGQISVESSCLCNFYFQFPRSHYFVHECGEPAL